MQRIYISLLNVYLEPIQYLVHYSQANACTLLFPIGNRFNFKVH
jgi:hypothetical protein